MAFHLLERNRDGARRIADKLVTAADQIQHCNDCRTFSELEQCMICANPARDKSLLCIVEGPADVLAIEQTGGFRGLYFCVDGAPLAT